MKKIITLIMLSFATITLQYCTDESETDALEKIQFTCSFTDVDSGTGRSKAGDDPDEVVINLETTSGETVVELQSIKLLRLGDSFISEPIALSPGRYNVTLFMLKAGGTVTYVAPARGGQLARAVNHPLPYTINVSKGRVSTIHMEVIAIGQHEPEDFGYTSFFINAVNPLQLSAFIAQNDKMVFTTATAYIIEGDDTIKTQNLRAAINHFSFKGDPNILRTLVVAKPGYVTFIKEFNYDDLIAELDGRSIEVLFKPAVFTIKPLTVNYSMQLLGQSGTIQIDWGDGVTDTYHLEPVSVTHRTHHYAAEGDYQINITGDIDKIEYYAAIVWGTKDVNVQGLIGLKEIGIDFTQQGPAVIDFSNNAHLEQIGLSAVPALRKIIFPENRSNRITILGINGPNSMTVEDVDRTLSDLYSIVVRNHVENGILEFSKSYYEGEVDVMLGPPSPAVIDMLRDMQNNYHWTISPAIP